MSRRVSRRTLLGLLIIPIVISIGFNVYMIRSIRSSLRLTPSGVVSDLYPSWRGTHDLLLHGTNPYSDAQTIEYQRGYYGRIPDDAGIGGGVGYQGFVYPLFLSVVIAPLAILPFGLVQWLAIIGMLAIIAWSAKSWMGLVGWPVRDRDRWIAGILWAGSAPSLYLVSLQQLTGLVVGILGLTAFAMARRRYGWAGVLLALGMFKPQLTLIALMGVAIWAWREHGLGRFLRGFAVSGALLVGASLALQPDWPRWFISQARTYAATNHLWGFLSIFPNGMPRTAAMAFVVLVSLVCCALPWLIDAEPEPRFTDAFALLIAATLIVNQGILVYNAVLLFFPLVVVLHRCARHDLSYVRLPSSAGLALIGLSVVSGISGAAMVLTGHTGVAGAMIELMGLGFVAAALPLWVALIALHLSLRGDRLALPFARKAATRS